MNNPENILRALEGSATTIDTKIAYHGSVLKVEFICQRGKYFAYYELLAGEFWKECSKDRAIEILAVY